MAQIKTGHEALSDRMANIESSVTSFKKNLSEIETQCAELKDAIEFQGAELGEVKEKTIPDVKVKCDANTQRALDSILDTKVWLRKWNLILYNVPGSKDEETADTRDKVRGVIEDGLGMTGEIPLAAAHRLPSRSNHKDAPPPIIVRFVDLDHRDGVLWKASNLRKVEIYKKVGIVPDLPPELRGRRASLLKMKAQLPQDQRAKAKLVYLKKPPYLLLKAGKGTIEAD